MIEQDVKPVPVSSRLMEDFQFQDWLLKVGLMKRIDPIPEPSIVGRMSLAEGMIWQRLLDRPGYLRSYHHLVPDRYNLDYAPTRDYLKIVVSLIRKKVSPPLIFTAPGFGYGLGISEMRLQRETGRVLYRLWMDLNQDVTQKDLAESITGSGDQLARSVIRNHIMHLRIASSSDTAASIETIRADRMSAYKESSYRLVELEGR